MQLQKYASKNLYKLFSATGVFPYMPEKIDISRYPKDISSDPSPDDSSVHVRCTTCRKNDVELHPLVRQGFIPKHLADAFMKKNRC